jgi:ketosteroid isomerase-like protein
MVIPAPTILGLVAALGAAGAVGTANDDRTRVSQLDVAYQAAVKRNDADGMARILDMDFVLILGNGTQISRDQLLATSRGQTAIYEHQDEIPGTQVVHLYGDTAVVTALLWLKGTNAGKPFERKLWFSDTYVRRPGDWRYAHGQASLPLPAETAAN